MLLEQRERYINPYADLGFKKLFGVEMNKELLISFLNSLFHGDVVAKDVTCLPIHQFATYSNRHAIFNKYSYFKFKSYKL